MPSRPVQSVTAPLTEGAPLWREVGPTPATEPLGPVPVSAPPPEYLNSKGYKIVDLMKAWGKSLEAPLAQNVQDDNQGDSPSQHSSSRGMYGAFSNPLVKSRPASMQLPPAGTASYTLGTPPPPWERPPGIPQSPEARPLPTPNDAQAKREQPGSRMVAEPTSAPRETSRILAGTFLPSPLSEHGAVPQMQRMQIEIENLMSRQEAQESCGQSQAERLEAIENRQRQHEVEAADMDIREGIGGTVAIRRGIEGFRAQLDASAVPVAKPEGVRDVNVHDAVPRVLSNHGQSVEDLRKQVQEMKSVLQMPHPVT